MSLTKNVTLPFSGSGFHLQSIDCLCICYGGCRSPSAGKLVRFLVDDGGHVFAGDAYAEIEVHEKLWLG